MAKVNLGDNIYETKYFERNTKTPTHFDGILQVAESVDTRLRSTLSKTLRENSITYYIKDESGSRPNLVYKIISTYDLFESSWLFRYHVYEYDFLGTFEATPGTFNVAKIVKTFPRKPKKDKSL